MDQAQPFTQLDFRPLRGCSSPHIQTLFACFSQPGKPPPSTPFLVALEDGDHLSCQISTPPAWTPVDKSVILVHGLCGNQDSVYMVRLSRKLYQAGTRAIRINMRCCGSGNGLARLPYHGGVSADILRVVQMLQVQYPLSPMILIGFSLGGNVVLKLAGELGETAPKMLKRTIAVCAPLDLAHTAHILAKPHNLVYNRYYLSRLQKEAHRWLANRPCHTMQEFDSLVTAPQWGFRNAQDYYEKSSSYKLLTKIRHPTFLLFAQDDPFIDYKISLQHPFSSYVNVFLTANGGHMGFFGWADQENRYFWLDHQLLKWINKL